MGSCIQLIERKYYIKDLFRPKQILNQFTDLYFESFKSFSELLRNDYIKLQDLRIHIPINNKEEFLLFAKLAKNTKICEMVDLFLQIRSDLLKDIFETEIRKCLNKRFIIVTDNEFDKKIRYYAKKPAIEWITQNRLFIRTEINYDNYDSVIDNQILPIYNKLGWRFFKIEFRWNTFEEMKLKEIHKLRFFLNHLKYWINTTRRRKDPEIVLYKKGKSIFVSNDFKLYESERSFKDNNCLIDLYKYRDFNGEDIPYNILNKFRSYMDLKKRGDLYQNKKVMDDYMQEPYLKRIVGDILNAF